MNLCGRVNNINRVYVLWYYFVVILKILLIGENKHVLKQIVSTYASYFAHATHLQDSPPVVMKQPKVRGYLIGD